MKTIKYQQAPKVVYQKSKLKGVQDSLLLKLLDMFSYCRPHASETETEFLNRFILPLKPTLVDGAGNLHFDRRTLEEHRTLFVAHVDTVHRTAGRQNVYYDADKHVIHTDGQCLGSDDGAGVAILLHMLAEEVPGYYIFTRCEERGGVGAKYLAEEMPQLLAQFDRAIAFDRKDTYSVITHQFGGRCCSEEFAEALAEELSVYGLTYMPDDTGVYTDTAEFTLEIPECTNLSVGYMHEHTPNEVLHYSHFKQLAQTVSLINWDALPVKRITSTLDDWGPDDVFTGDGEFAWPVKEGLLIALEDALTGSADDLLFFMGDFLFPEDPDLVWDTVDPYTIPTESLRAAIRDIETTDPYTILQHLYEDVANYAPH